MFSGKLWDSRPGLDGGVGVQLPYFTRPVCHIASCVCGVALFLPQVTDQERWDRRNGRQEPLKNSDDEVNQDRKLAAL